MLIKLTLLCIFFWVNICQFSLICRKVRMYKILEKIDFFLLNFSNFFIKCICVHFNFYPDTFTEWRPVNIPLKIGFITVRPYIRNFLMYGIHILSCDNFRNCKFLRFHLPSAARFASNTFSTTQLPPDTRFLAVELLPAASPLTAVSEWSLSDRTTREIATGEAESTSPATQPICDAKTVTQ